MKNLAPKILPPVDRKGVLQITAIPESDSHSFTLLALTADGEIFSNVWELTTNPPYWEGWVPVPPVTRDGEPWP